MPETACSDALGAVDGAATPLRPPPRGGPGGIIPPGQGVKGGGSPLAAGGILPLEVGIAAQTVFKGLQDLLTLRGRDSLFTYGPFGGYTEILKDAPGIVVHRV